MKFRAITFSAAALAASMVLSGCCKHFDSKFDLDAPNAKIEISKAPGKVSVDGVIGKNEWKGAAVYNMSRAYRVFLKKSTPAKILAHTSEKGKDVEKFEGGKVRFMYDNNFLYVAVELTDSDIMQYSTEDQTKLLGMGDAAAIYLKPANSPSYWECLLAPNGKKASFFLASRGYPVNPDANAIMPGMKAAAKLKGTINNYYKKDTGWTVEAAIPVKELKKAGLDFKPGKKWTILLGRFNYNFNVNDVDPQYSTCPEMPANSFHHTEYYADIIWK